MSKYEFESAPIRVDLVDDAGWAEEDLDSMHPDEVYDLARSVIGQHYNAVRRV